MSPPPAMHPIRYLIHQFGATLVLPVVHCFLQAPGTLYKIFLILEKSAPFGIMLLKIEFNSLYRSL
jgi:hypothetical protein